MEKQKFQIGDWVSVEFIGVIEKIELHNGKIRYVISEPNEGINIGTTAMFVKESFIYPLQKEEDK